MHLRVGIYIPYSSFSISLLFYCTYIQKSYLYICKLLTILRVFYFEATPYILYSYTILFQFILLKSKKHKEILCVFGINFVLSILRPPLGFFVYHTIHPYIITILLQFILLKCLKSIVPQGFPELFFGFQIQIAPVTIYSYYIPYSSFSII